jgi:hypothetical protein
MFAYDTIALRDDLIGQAADLHLDIPAEVRAAARVVPTEGALAPPAKTRPRDEAARHYYVRNPFAPAR